MVDTHSKVTEEIQRLIARLLATSPAGVGLCLIGGFRYRFLDHSVRLSRDLDYHWEGDLEAKQAELVSLFTRRLLPEVKRRMNLNGDVRQSTGPDSESPSVRVVELAFWSPSTGGRIEIPVDITRILCADPLTVRTADGVVYPTPSDADMVESKVIALFNRRHIEHRDFVDLFLFSSHLQPDSADRLRLKVSSLSMGPAIIRRQLQDFAQYPDYHVKSIAAVISGQLDTSAADQIAAGGGAKLVFDTVHQLLVQKLRLGEGGTS